MDQRGPTPFADTMMLCAGEEISVSDTILHFAWRFFKKPKPQVKSGHIVGNPNLCGDKLVLFISTSSGIEESLDSSPLPMCLDLLNTKCFVGYTYLYTLNTF
jgi:hypothetical protein